MTISILGNEKGPIVRAKINEIITEVNLGGGGSGDMLASTYDPANIAQQVVGTTTTQTLTNKTMTGSTNTITASVLKSATTEIDISSATAPTTGQVLTATSSTTAEWETPSAGSAEWTLIETLTPSAVTTFDSAIFTAYDRLRVEISMDTSISTTVLGLRFNTYSGVYNFRRINGTTIQASSGFQIDITNFAQSYLFIGELFIAGKGVQKPFYANGSQYTTDVQVMGGTITGGLAVDITQLNFLRSSGTGTFTGTVNIYGKNY